MPAAIAIAAAAMLNVTGVSGHDPQFHPYSAPLPAFSGGEGGKQTSALGIEVWSQGAPNRPFQILGTLTDNRAIGPYDGPSSSGFVKIIARGTKAAGGDAAILDEAVPDSQQRSTARTTGTIRNFLDGSRPPPEGQPSYITRFWVVKYLAAVPARPEAAAK